MIYDVQGNNKKKEEKIVLFFLLFIIDYFSWNLMNSSIAAFGKRLSE